MYFPRSKERKKEGGKERGRAGERESAMGILIAMKVG